MNLPTMRSLLSATNHAEIARRLGKPRAYVWRLAQGGILKDASVIPALAQALHQPEELIRRVVERDTQRILCARGERSA